MKSRTTFGLIAFFLTFGISASLVGLLFGFPKVTRHGYHANHTAAAISIESVLDKDIRFGEIRRRSQVRLAREIGGTNGKLEIPLGPPEHASIIGRYTSDAAGIDIARTPADFKYAWAKHMQAWDRYTVYSKALAAGANENLSSLNYDPDEINDTYHQVLRIAQRYGAHIKPRYLR